jgi:hypothetical protein
MIGKHFNKEYTTRNVLAAKIRWYWQHQNMTSVSKIYFSQLAKYPPVDLSGELDMINEVCWQTIPVF